MGHCGTSAKGVEVLGGISASPPVAIAAIAITMRGAYTGPVTPVYDQPVAMWWARGARRVHVSGQEGTCIRCIHACDVVRGCLQAGLEARHGRVVRGASAGAPSERKIA